jgi:mono/diheme cytochrome c family protein
MMKHKQVSPLHLLGFSFGLAVAVTATASSPIVNPGVLAQSAPTYYRDIQPILEANCVTCHVEGGIAPFALDSGQKAVTWAKAMAVEVQSGAMPPFPPGEDSPPFLDERKLSAAQKKLITDWANAGAPLGQKRENQKP